MWACACTRTIRFCSHGILLGTVQRPALMPSRSNRRHRRWALRFPLWRSKRRRRSRVSGLVMAVTGCNPNTFKTVPSGGSKAIAVVDAYNYPTAMADLNKLLDAVRPAFSDHLHIQSAVCRYRRRPNRRRTTADGRPSKRSILNGRMPWPHTRKSFSWRWPPLALKIRVLRI